MIVMLTVDNVKKIEPASRGDIGWPVLVVNMQAVGFGGGLELHIVVIAVVAYVLDAMLQVI